MPCLKIIKSGSDYLVFLKIGELSISGQLLNSHNWLCLVQFNSELVMYC